MTEEELKGRIRAAITLLRDGHSMKVGDLTFGCTDKNHFSVTGWANSNDLRNITMQSAINELEEIKSLFASMRDKSIELADFIEGRQVEYYLDFDDGKGAIGICHEKNRELTWEITLKI